MGMQQAGSERTKATGRRNAAADNGLDTDKAGRQRPAKEIELKFQVPELAREALNQDLENRQCRITRLKAHYYDTDEGSLAEAGISLRLRQVDKQWFQTLKITLKGRIYEREEHEVKVPGARKGTPPPLDISRHDGTPAGDSLRKSMKSCGNPELAERYATEVERRTWDLAEGDNRVELAFDQGRVVAGDREETLCELEFELKSGEGEALCALAADWVGRYGLWLSTESKSARGERLVAGRPLPVVKATPPRLEEGMSPDAALRATARSCLDQIAPNASAIASGSRDHDHVHQLRVGLRRLRTAMRELGGLSEGLDSAWESPLAEAFRQLGAYRDREAVLEAIKPGLLKAGANSVDWMKMEGALADPVATVRDPDFQMTLLDVLGFTLGQDGEAGRDGGREELQQYFRRRLNSLHSRVVGDGMAFKSLSESAQHRVRKRLKRLRYLSEFVSSLFGRSSVEAYLEHLRPAQDALGEHNDYAVAAELAHGAAERGNPDADFALGWLEDQRKQSVKSSSKALKKIGEAARFWKKSLAAH